MRYLFNSYSMPDASLDELFSAAHQYGYDGIELRLESDHGHGVEVSLDDASRAIIRKQIETESLEVACLCTSAKLAIPAVAREGVETCNRAVRLAADIGVPYIRVFGGLIPDSVSRDAATANLVESLQHAAAYASELGVSVLIETHDDWAEPWRLARIMEAVESPGAGVLWDVWHTGRAGHASVSAAYETLKPWIRHVQMHDGLLRQDRLDWRRIGQGEVDHLELLACLVGGDYPGAIAGEWMDGEPADVQLPRELTTMRRYEDLLAGVRSAR